MKTYLRTFSSQSTFETNMPFNKLYVISVRKCYSSLKTNTLQSPENLISTYNN